MRPAPLQTPHFRSIQPRKLQWAQESEGEDIFSVLELVGCRELKVSVELVPFVQVSFFGGGFGMAFFLKGSIYRFVGY